MLAVEASFSKNRTGTWLETEVMDTPRKFDKSTCFLVVWTEPMCINTHHSIACIIRIQIVPSVDRPFDYTVPIGSSDVPLFHFFFQLGMAVNA